MTANNLHRFHKAQENTWQQAFNELSNGKKTGHWMWFIFPQLSGLGFSEMSKFYGIRGLDEAELYVQDPVLSKHLISISSLLLQIEQRTAHDLFGSPDDMKLKSSMTLFSSVKNADPVFQQVLDRYFGGSKDEKTSKLIEAEQ